ncbi:DNA polymerase IV [Gallaecimonas kandeliae]|uniref:DNA polymerase IV n=1 Tax=Gallaecimonas kandeliae TaxID=3029055 RepID=UPI002647F9DD|nr:DNA polymerase IV [Gallaecimonas kandeliae]WKE67429.1 DNA polymerase IV [Gallaecimonas kandeliae]
MRKIIHVDMDCFFAAVEMRDNPALKTVPLAIGGAAERRGVIATCNYEARKYGVRSAMSTHKAQQLCPQLVLLPGRMALYKTVSQQIRAIFARYTDLIEPLSLDEAYLDVTDSPHCRGSASLIAEAIRADIRRELDLTASAGVAPNKFLAKIASEENKPDGLFVIRPEQVADFVRELPLRKIPGVGPATEAQLASLGLKSCADIQACDRDWFLKQTGKFGAALYERAFGRDERPLVLSRERKSVGVETTVPKDLLSLAEVRALAAELRPELERRLGDRPIAKLGVKLKFADFTQTTMEHISPALEQGLFEVLLEGAYQRGQGRGVRLVGLFVGLAPPRQACQLALPFEDGD